MAKFIQVEDGMIIAKLQIDGDSNITSIIEADYHAIKEEEKGLRCGDNVILTNGIYVKKVLSE